jgi:hypothetical protein
MSTFDDPLVIDEELLDTYRTNYEPYYWGTYPRDVPEIPETEDAFDVMDDDEFLDKDFLKDLDEEVESFLPANPNNNNPAATKEFPTKSQDNVGVLFEKRCTLEELVDDGKIPEKELVKLNNFLITRTGERAPMIQKPGLRIGIDAKYLCEKLRKYFARHQNELRRYLEASPKHFLNLPPEVITMIMATTVDMHPTLVGKYRQMAIFNRINRYIADISKAHLAHLPDVSMGLEEVARAFWSSVIASLYDSTVAGFSVILPMRYNDGVYYVSMIQVRRRIIDLKQKNLNPEKKQVKLKIDRDFGDVRKSVYIDLEFSGFFSYSPQINRWKSAQGVIRSRQLWDHRLLRPTGHGLQSKDPVVAMGELPSLEPQYRTLYGGMLDTFSFRLRQIATRSTFHPGEAHYENIIADTKWLNQGKYYFEHGAENVHIMNVEDAGKENEYTVYTKTGEYSTENIVKGLGLVVKPSDLLDLLMLKDEEYEFQRKQGVDRPRSKIRGPLAPFLFDINRVGVVFHPLGGNIAIAKADDSMPGPEITTLIAQEGAKVETETKSRTDPSSFPAVSTSMVAHIHHYRDISDYTGWDAISRGLLRNDPMRLGVPFTSILAKTGYGSVAWFWWMETLRHMAEEENIPNYRRHLMSRIINNSILISPLHHFYALRQRGSWTMGGNENPDMAHFFKDLSTQAIEDVEYTRHNQLSMLTLLDYLGPVQL